MKQITSEAGPEIERPAETVDPAAAQPPRASLIQRREGAAMTHAFVVQLAADWEAGSGGLSGRVQHLESGDGGKFESTEGLVAIVRRISRRIARTHAED
jgi:hypothetical protein